MYVCECFVHKKSPRIYLNVKYVLEDPRHILFGSENKRHNYVKFMTIYLSLMHWIICTVLLKNELW